MNLGAVPYVNAIPLIRGLKEEVRKAPPAALARLLASGELDLATAPVTTLFDNPTWKAIPNIAIGTKGASKSVLVFMKNPKTTFGNVKSIYVDGESKTSAMLLRVLVGVKYERNLGEIEFFSEPRDDVEAKLMIGDKALKESSLFKGKIYDLGTEWTSWTSLPFVFACWVTPHELVSLEMAARLKRCVEQNLKTIDGLIGEINGFDHGLLKDYFTKHMDYGFGEKEQEGLVAFHQYLCKLKLVDKPFTLRFVEP